MDESKKLNWAASVTNILSFIVGKNKRFISYPNNKWTFPLGIWKYAQSNFFVYIYCMKLLELNTKVTWKQLNAESIWNNFLLVLPKKGAFPEDFVDRCRSTNTLFLVGLIFQQFIKGSEFILLYFVRQFSEHNL